LKQFFINEIVALATACALVGIECEIHMGEIDIEKVGRFLFLNKKKITLKQH
jgi:tryptophan synthase beta subunit